MNDEEDFLERHADGIENAMLKKRVEELEGNAKLLAIRLPHSGEWVRTVDANGQLKLSYPPGYDDAKDEALRMLDDDQWKLSLWESRHHRQTRWLYLATIATLVFGFVAIPSTWHRGIIAIGTIVVLHSYLRYGNPSKNPLARLRGYFRRGV